MNAARTRLLDEIYVQALGLNGRDRRAFLARRCGEDDELRREVLALLAAADAADDRLDRQVGAVRERLWRAMTEADGDSQEDLAGQCIGGWRIDEKVARGGLATVYRARGEGARSARSAAFKVLRRGLDTDDVIARFRAERQILASLHHPSIARMLDAGALADGRPFIVMEFVDGEPITAYCEQRGVDTSGRLRLLVEVLHALHHAHLNRVVHRDVKPSNVLVSREGKVVLLDFGIARLLDGGRASGASPMTGAGVSLLTPGYASPEQYSGQFVSTASDVYQAGLMLYEFLTGERPFEGKPADSGFLVPPPSAALRRTPRHEAVRGDLDAITRKATQVDAALRYASAEEMARDLQRHLAGRPVLARQDALRDRLRRLEPRPWLTTAITVAAAGAVAWAVSQTA